MSSLGRTSFNVDMAKRAGRVRLNGLWVKWVTSQKRVILSGLKTSSGQFGWWLGLVVPYFSQELNNK